MANSLIKGQIGKEDLEIDITGSTTETFSRISSTGGTLSLTKFPDLWGGTGRIYVAKIQTAQTDPGDITETVVAGTLTHDVLKNKINGILAIMRNLEII